MMNYDHNNWNPHPYPQIREDNFGDEDGDAKNDTITFDRNFRQGMIYPRGGYNPNFPNPGRSSSGGVNDNHVSMSQPPGTTNYPQQFNGMNQTPMNPMMMNHQFSQQQPPFANQFNANPDARGMSHGEQGDGNFDFHGQQQQQQQQNPMTNNQQMNPSMNPQMFQQHGQLSHQMDNQDIMGQQQQHPNDMMNQSTGEQNMMHQPRGFGQQMGQPMGQQMGQQMNFPRTQMQQGNDNPMFQQGPYSPSFPNSFQNQPFNAGHMAQKITPDRKFGGRQQSMSHLPHHMGANFFPFRNSNRKRMYGEIRPSVSSSSEEGEKQKVDDPDIICRCIKSRCLKLYCDCFQAGVLCNTHCKCVRCLNTETENKKGGRLKQAKRDYILRKPGVFGKKPKKTEDYCSCKNNRCLKKYCYCFRNNISCTDRCFCVNCENQDIHKLKGSQEDDTSFDKESDKESDKETDKHSDKESEDGHSEKNETNNDNKQEEDPDDKKSERKSDESQSASNENEGKS